MTSIVHPLSTFSNYTIDGRFITIANGWELKTINGNVRKYNLKKNITSTQCNSFGHGRHFRFVKVDSYLGTQLRGNCNHWRFVNGKSTVCDINGKCMKSDSVSQNEIYKHKVVNIIFSCLSLSKSTRGCVLSGNQLYIHNIYEMR